MKVLQLITIPLALLAVSVQAAETNPPDLPPHEQVDVAISSHINVINAETAVKIEEVNQRKWEGGNYELNLRAGSSRRQIANDEDKLKEWDIAMERPLRLINKVMIDYDIGAEGVLRARSALGDARHEAGRTLLHLWFNWQREMMQVAQWQQQVENLTQQAMTTEKRLKAGDAPRMELGQANAAVSQASVSLQQARMRAELAGNELKQQFPAIILPQRLNPEEPQALTTNFEHWRQTILESNHELEMVRSESRIQQMLAKRSRADRLPDPTVGLRYSNEMGGKEKVAGVYISVPLSFGIRGASAENAEHQAQIALDRENAIHRRLESDIYAAHIQATSSYHIWQQAREAAVGIRQNADLLSRAYSLGEISLSDALAARRLALEAALSENLTRLDANEARYRLLLDAHQLWSADADQNGVH